MLTKLVAIPMEEVDGLEMTWVCVAWGLTIWSFSVLGEASVTFGSWGVNAAFVLKSCHFAAVLVTFFLGILKKMGLVQGISDNMFKGHYNQMRGVYSDSW